MFYAHLTDYFMPKQVQTSIVQEYDEMVPPNNPINPDQAGALNTIEFSMKGAVDLYRDLNNSYLMLQLKVVKSDNSNLALDAPVSLTNLPLHSLFSNVGLTLCGKEITENDTLYPYRAYLETLLNYDKEVLETRCEAEGWAKDTAGCMDNLVLVKAGSGPEPNKGFVARQEMIKGSKPFTLVGRPHLDLFHQNLDIPPGCSIVIKFTPSPAGFALMEADTGTSKILLLDAKFFVRTKRLSPELILGHKEMLERADMFFPVNRVMVKRIGVSPGFTHVDIPLLFPAKLPKRIVVGFVKNTASAGKRDENPFNFRHLGITRLSLNVNGQQIPANELTMNFATGDVQRAYLNTLAALGYDNGDRSINIKTKDFAQGYTLFGFKIAPGPIDGNVHSASNTVGSMNLSAHFAHGLVDNVDLIVFAELPATVEINKLGDVIVV